MRMPPFALWFASALLACAASAAQAASFPAYPFVHGTGSAERWVAPDVGEIEFDIVLRDADSAALWQAMQGKTEHIRAAFREQQVADDDVTVFDLQKSTVDGPAGEQGAPVRLTQLRRSLRVKVRDLSNWAAIIQPLLADSAVTQVDVQFARLDQDRIRAELDAEAADDARAYAARLAKAFGRRLDLAVAITPGELKDMGAMFKLDDGARQKGVVAKRRPSADVPQVIRFYQQFHVIYKLR